MIGLKVEKEYFKILIIYNLYIMNLWYIKNLYDYGYIIVDGIYFYCDPYGYMYSKLLSKETLKQVCIVTYPYTQDYIISRLAREVPIKELELDDLKKHT